MYVHKDFFDLVDFLSKMEGKRKVDITKEIAEIVRDNYRKEFKLFR